ncbi:MAG: hypothetical protein LC135_11775 [Phycisphaerae bacterium]|nr:hypothetical protein [Phycisphaerae bacterium]MCZ2400527.1 hypothetical protein [Phycisphaerae bacterium]NUQ50285.1 hypothetical protein [Phycisphaerae bacterium]
MPDAWVVAWVAGGVCVVVLAVAIRWWQRRREAAYDARRRAELRESRGYLYMQQQELERLAARIIATSSTATIAGFQIVRQIEAVFTDGHISPTRAVDVLKALAAEKGGNAIVNLASERLPTGKCAARGDAVIVRTLDA